MEHSRVRIHSFTAPHKTLPAQTHGPDVKNITYLWPFYSVWTIYLPVALPAPEMEELSADVDDRSESENRTVRTYVEPEPEPEQTAADATREKQPGGNSATCVLADKVASHARKTRPAENLSRGLSIPINRDVWWGDE